jgi:hypothetical protein
MTDADAAGSDSNELRTAWVEASFQLLRLAQQSDLGPDDPSRRVYEDAARAAITKHGTPEQRADLAYIVARNRVYAGRWREALPLVESRDRSGALGRPTEAGNCGTTRIAVQSRARGCRRRTEAVCASTPPDFARLAIDELAADAFELAAQVYTTCGLLDLAARALDAFSTSARDASRPASTARQEKSRASSWRMRCRTSTRSCRSRRDFSRALSPRIRTFARECSCCAA